MKELSAVGVDETDQERDAGEYYSVEDEDGCLRCSCGRELIKMDEETYKCSGGYPVYRFSNSEIIIDRNGNLMFKSIPHGKDDGGED